MRSLTNFAGLNGFIWWVGVVENRMDPLNLCRCQIRVFGWHTENLQLIPTADLPWVQPIFPVNGSDIAKAPHEGDWVIGFFLDGDGAQVPMYWGVIPAIPHVAADQSKGFSDQRKSDQLANAPQPSLYPINLDEPTTSRLYQNKKIEKTIVQKIKDVLKKGISIAGGGTWDQPAPSYAAVPPYNSVKETESGHIMEFDDTKGAERINLYHMKGSYIEIRPDGSQVISIVGSNYKLVAGTDYASVVGDCNLTVGGNINIIGSSKVNVQVSSDTNVTVGGNVNLNVSGDVNGTASAFNLTGPVNIDGQVTVTGGLTTTEDVVAGTVSLQNHKTTLVQPGGGLSGPPAP